MTRESKEREAEGNRKRKEKKKKEEEKKQYSGQEKSSHSAKCFRGRLTHFQRWMGGLKWGSRDALGKSASENLGRWHCHRHDDNGVEKISNKTRPLGCPCGSKTFPLIPEMCHLDLFSSPSFIFPFFPSMASATHFEEGESEIRLS